LEGDARSRWCGATNILMEKRRLTSGLKRNFQSIPSRRIKVVSNWCRCIELKPKVSENQHQTPLINCSPVVQKLNLGTDSFARHAANRVRWSRAVLYTKLMSDPLIAREKSPKEAASIPGLTLSRVGLFKSFLLFFTKMKRAQFFKSQV